MKDVAFRNSLPGIYWRVGQDRFVQSDVSSEVAARYWLTPDVDTLPFIDRKFLVQDPCKAGDGKLESNMIGSRGVLMIAHSVAWRLASIQMS